MSNDDLDRIEDDIFDVDSRMLAIEIAFKALVVSLHKTEYLDRDHLLRELSQERNQFRAERGERWPQTVASLDVLIDQLDERLLPDPIIPAFDLPKAEPPIENGD